MIINEDFFDEIDDVTVSDNNKKGMTYDECYTFTAYFDFKFHDENLKKSDIESRKDILKWMNFIQKRYVEVFEISHVSVYDAVWMENVESENALLVDEPFIREYGNIKIGIFTQDSEVINGFYLYVYIDKTDITTLDARYMFKMLRNLDTLDAHLSLSDDNDKFGMILFTDNYYSIRKMAQMHFKAIQIGNPDKNIRKFDRLLSTNRSEDKLKNMYLYSQEWYDIAYTARLLNPECTYEKMLIGAKINEFGNDHKKYAQKNNTCTTQLILIGGHIQNTGYIEEDACHLNMFTKKAYAEENYKLIHSVKIKDINTTGYYFYIKNIYSYMSFVYVLDGTIKMNDTTFVPVLETKQSISTEHLKDMLEAAIVSQSELFNYIDRYKMLKPFKVMVDFAGGIVELRKILLDNKDAIQNFIH